jgi:hypothetical protein
MDHLFSVETSTDKQGKNPVFGWIRALPMIKLGNLLREVG